MEKYIITEFPIQGREPVLRKMKDGSLICTSLTGGEAEPRNYNYVGVCRSTDNGKTWTPSETLFSHHDRGTWCTEVFTECDVPFAVVSTYNAGTIYLELNNFFSYTHDNGKTWTVPVSPKGAIKGCCLRQGIVLSNGDILFPLYWAENVGNGDNTTKSRIEFNMGSSYIYRCGVGISHDGGQTWERYGYVDMGDTSLWEPNVVEAEDGHLIMYCRCNKGYLAVSHSYDFGKSWSQAVLSDIPNPDTKVTLTKIGKTILMINNFNSEVFARDHLQIWKSEDGVHFEKALSIEDDGARFFYPHALVDNKSRTLYVAYDNAKIHKLACIGFDELGL